ncbi:MAG: hypothetical protein AAGB51_07525 [Planctomycetota bacterium]
MMHARNAARWLSVAAAVSSAGFAQAQVMGGVKAESIRVDYNVPDPIAPPDDLSGIGQRIGLVLNQNIPIAQLSFIYGSELLNLDMGIVESSTVDTSVDNADGSRTTFYEASEGSLVASMLITLGNGTVLRADSSDKVNFALTDGDGDGMDSVAFTTTFRGNALSSAGIDSELTEVWTITWNLLLGASTLQRDAADAVNFGAAGAFPLVTGNLFIDSSLPLASSQGLQTDPLSGFQSFLFGADAEFEVIAVPAPSAAGVLGAALLITRRRQRD